MPSESKIGAVGGWWQDDVDADVSGKIVVIIRISSGFGLLGSQLADS